MMFLIDRGSPTKLRRLAILYVKVREKLTSCDAAEAPFGVYCTVSDAYSTAVFLSPDPAQL